MSFHHSLCIRYAPRVLLAVLALAHICQSVPADPYAQLSPKHLKDYPSRKNPDAPNAIKGVPIIVKKQKGQEPQIAMVGSQKGNDAKGLKFPRGKGKLNECPKNTCSREAYEETGYAKHQMKPVGKLINGADHSKQGDKTVTKPAVGQVYHLKKGAQPYAHEDRKVQFMPYSKAKETLRNNPGMHSMLEAAHDDIHRNTSPARSRSPSPARSRSPSSTSGSSSKSR